MAHVTFPLTSLSDLGALTRDLPQADVAAQDAARDRQNALTKPPGSLGRLEELAVFMAGWQQQAVQITVICPRQAARAPVSR